MYQVMCLVLGGRANKPAPPFVMYFARPLNLLLSRYSDDDVSAFGWNKSPDTNRQLLLKDMSPRTTDQPSQISSSSSSAVHDVAGMSFVSETTITSHTKMFLLSLALFEIMDGFAWMSSLESIGIVVMSAVEQLVNLSRILVHENSLEALREARFVTMPLQSARS